jgi:hypothetical protein
MAVLVSVKISNAKHSYNLNYSQLHSSAKKYVSHWHELSRYHIALKEHDV